MCASELYDDHHHHYQQQQQQQTTTTTGCSNGEYCYFSHHSALTLAEINEPNLVRCMIYSPFSCQPSGEDESSSSVPVVVLLGYQRGADTALPIYMK